MKKIVLIPSRLHSERLPEKPLKLIGNKTMINLVYEAATKSNADKTIIATDSELIFNEVINFSKQLKKLIIVTRGEKGAVAINGNEVVESSIQKNLKIIDLTGAGDLFAAGFLHGFLYRFDSSKLFLVIHQY